MKLIWRPLIKKVILIIIDGYGQTLDQMSSFDTLHSDEILN